VSDVAEREPEHPVLTCADIDLGPGEIVVGYAAVVRTMDATPGMVHQREAISYYVSSDVDRVLLKGMLMAAEEILDAEDHFRMVMEEEAEDED